MLFASLHPNSFHKIIRAIYPQTKPKAKHTIHIFGMFDHCTVIWSCASHGRRHDGRSQAGPPEGRQLKEKRHQNDTIIKLYRIEIKSNNDFGVYIYIYIQNRERIEMKLIKPKRWLCQLETTISRSSTPMWIWHVQGTLKIYYGCRSKTGQSSTRVPSIPALLLSSSDPLLERLGSHF